jgi:hypothetical protein
MMMPDAAGGHSRRFNALCERAIADDVVRKSDAGPCFASKQEFVLFEVFRRMYLSGAPGRAECPPMHELLADLAGARLTGVA